MRSGGKKLSNRKYDLPVKISINGCNIVGVSSGSTTNAGVNNGNNLSSNNNLNNITTSGGGGGSGSKDEVWFRVNMKLENPYGDAWQKMDGNMKQVGRRRLRAW